MDEMTNQSIETTATEVTTETSTDDFLSAFEESLSDETKPEEIASDSEEAESEESENAETEDSAEHEESIEEPFLTANFLGQEIPLTRERSTELVQKGLNYERILPELEGLRASNKLMGVINELATQAGATPEQFVENLGAFQKNQMIQQFAMKIKEQYPDAPDQLINEMATSKYNSYSSDKKQQEALMQQKNEQQKRDELIRLIENFEKEYPGVDLKNLPQEVVTLINQGETLISAYRIYDLKQQKQALESLKKENAALKQNNKNRSKSTGSLSSGIKEAEVDPFIAMLK